MNWAKRCNASFDLPYIFTLSKKVGRGFASRGSYNNSSCGVASLCASEDTNTMRGFGDCLMTPRSKLVRRKAPEKTKD